MLVLLFCNWMFGHLFSILCFSWSVIIVCFMECQRGTTIEQFNGISHTPFTFKNWFFLFIYRPWGYIYFFIEKCVIIERLFCWISKCFYVLDDLFFLLLQLWLEGYYELGSVLPSGSFLGIGWLVFFWNAAWC